MAPYAYLVSKKLEEGHICLSLTALEEEAKKIPEQDWTRYLSDSSILSTCRFVSADPANCQPFALSNNRLYLHRYFEYEKLIAAKITAIIESGKEKAEARLSQLRQQKEFVEGLFGNEKLPGDVASDERIHWQLIAALSCFINSFTIVTGGPGTGKTTTVAKVLSLLYAGHPELRVAMAAPTGKAAVRLTESLHGADISVSNEIKDWLKTISATTIHTLLKPQKSSLSFKHNATNPLDADVIIVDESSMIDVALFAKLLDAIPNGAKLILLGDRNQLASVEAGSLFGDLCLLKENKGGDLVNRFTTDNARFFNSFISDPARRLNGDSIADTIHHPLAGHIVELKYSWRFVKQPLIGKFSKAVIEGDKKTVEKFIAENDHQQLRIDTTYSEYVFEDFIAGYKHYLAKDIAPYSEENIRTALDRFNRLKILCALREGKYGVSKINEKVEAWLKKEGLLKVRSEFYEHQPVMVTRNNKALGLANGDIGIIRKDETGELKAWFIDGSKEARSSEETDGKKQLRKVSLGYLSDVETVFAMTIHKSQGSEYDQVLVMLPDDEENALLTRELLYTAVTRAKTDVLIQGKKEVILKATEESVKRASGISDRF